MTTHIHIPDQSALSEYVTAIWEINGDRRVRETILPKGIIEIVFNLGDDMKGTQSLNNRIFQPARCFVQGLYTEALTVSYSEQHHLFGIQLKPHMVKRLLRLTSSELKDQVVDLSLVSRTINDLWNQLGESQDFEERVKIIEHNFPLLDPEDCSRTKKLSTLFYSNTIEGFQSMDTLSQQVCYSTRHLNRKIQSIFGVSAEELISYKKFLHSIRLIHQENLSLSKVANRSGFYDPSHFSRTFKSFAGMTANEYNLRKGSLPHHFFS